MNIIPEVRIFIYLFHALQRFIFTQSNMIMNDTVKIFCENTGANLFVNQGTSLLQVAQMLSLEKGNDTPLLAAYVDNRLKELSYRI